MSVEIVTPEDYEAAIQGDIQSRRGIVDNVGNRINLKVLDCKVPLANMFSYIADLRALSKGRATFCMEFACYDPMPESLAEELIGKKK